MHWKGLHHLNSSHGFLCLLIDLLAHTLEVESSRCVFESGMGRHDLTEVSGGLGVLPLRIQIINRGPTRSPLLIFILVILLVAIGIGAAIAGSLPKQLLQPIPDLLGRRNIQSVQRAGQGRSHAATVLEDCGCGILIEIDHILGKL